MTLYMIISALVMLALLISIVVLINIVHRLNRDVDFIIEIMEDDILNRLNYEKTINNTEENYSSTTNTENSNTN